MKDLKHGPRMYKPSYLPMEVMLDSSIRRVHHLLQKASQGSAFPILDGLRASGMNFYEEPISVVVSDLAVDNMKREYIIVDLSSPDVLHPVGCDKLMWVGGAFMERSKKDVDFAIQRAVLDDTDKPLFTIRPNGDAYLYPLRRPTIYQSMEIEGVIQNMSIHFLIDTGSGLNFISERCVQMLGLKRVPVEKFCVVVANDAKMEVADMCENVVWRGQGVDFKADFYVLPMQSSQAILGMQWLVTLGAIHLDFRSRTVQFQRGDEMVCLRAAAMDDDVGQASSIEGSIGIQYASARLSPAVSRAIQHTTACVVPAC